MQNVRLHYQTVGLNEEGNIDDGAVTVFTMGHCHSLALALSEMTGWPIYGLDYNKNTDSPSHCVVYSPELKEYIDIQGKGVLGRWSRHQLTKRISRKAIEKGLPYYMKVDTEFAKPFAISLLKSLNVTPKTKKQNSVKKLLTKKQAACSI